MGLFLVIHMPVILAIVHATKSVPCMDEIQYLGGYLGAL